MYNYRTEQFLKVDIDTAWDFFSSAKNLAVITPPELSFKILTNLDDSEVYEGMLIDYTVNPLFGIPLKWQTEICKVQRPLLFTDRQLKGPYSVWEHTHTFIEQNNGVLMKDEVNYKLPLGFLGDIANYLVVKKKIAGIFEYREQALNRIFR